MDEKVEHSLEQEQKNDKDSIKDSEDVAIPLVKPSRVDGNVIKDIAYSKVHSGSLKLKIKGKTGILNKKIKKKKKKEEKSASEKLDERSKIKRDKFCW